MKSTKQSSRRKKAVTRPQQITSYPCPVADFSRGLRSFTQRKLTASQWVNYGVVTSTSAANGYYAFSVSLGDLPDNANYSSIFDSYRFDYLELHLIPTSQACLPATANAYAFAYVAHDLDDATAPASLSTLLSYDNCTVLGPGEKHIRRIKPCIAAAATSSAAAAITGSMQTESPWLDMTSSNVQHYGFKIAVTQSTSTSLSSWQCFIYATVSMKNLR